MAEDKAAPQTAPTVLPVLSQVVSRVEEVGVNGIVLLPVSDEEDRAVVMDYLFGLVWRYKKSIREMLMTDSCAMSAVEMRYFDRRFYGRVPSYSYWKTWFNRLDGMVKDDIELTERELIKTGYVDEMEEIARHGEGSREENRVFGYWQKLHALADKESGRIEQRAVKREMSRVGFSQGVDRTLEVLRKIKDADLIEMRSVIEGVAQERGVLQVTDGRSGGNGGDK